MGLGTKRGKSEWGTVNEEETKKEGTCLGDGGSRGTGGGCRNGGEDDDRGSVGGRVVVVGWTCCEL